MLPAGGGASDEISCCSWCSACREAMQKPTCGGGLASPAARCAVGTTMCGGCCRCGDSSTVGSCGGEPTLGRLPTSPAAGSAGEPGSVKTILPLLAFPGARPAGCAGQQCQLKGY